MGEAQVATAEEEAHKAVGEHAQTSQAKDMKLQEEAAEAKRKEADMQANATSAQKLAAAADAKVKDLQNRLNSTALSAEEKVALQKELDKAIEDKEAKEK